ncbi:MAG: hypothetical protein LBR53_11710 [Deltaproteobacteria bacterium]|jgi:hypothetical protein|nr:hypothetical protein [Deltaproteobacteria bacterium]
MTYKWKLLFAGLGFIAGIGAASFFARRPAFVRNAASTLLSYGIAAKRELETVTELAKENISDLVAEAELKADDRQKEKD